eukprot:scaffold181038_cov40-Prasinocladus_malaysianus.AAC.2
MNECVSFALFPAALEYLHGGPLRRCRQSHMKSLAPAILATTATCLPPCPRRWFDMAQPKSTNTRLSNNWFSLLTSQVPKKFASFSYAKAIVCRPRGVQSANRVYKQFSSLDQNMTGSLSQEDFGLFSRTMTKLFVSRVFEEHVGRSRMRGGPSSTGKMVFQVCPWRCIAGTH